MICASFLGLRDSICFFRGFSDWLAGHCFTLGCLLSLASRSFLHRPVGAKRTKKTLRGQPPSRIISRCANHECHDTLRSQSALLFQRQQLRGCCVSGKTGKTHTHTHTHTHTSGYPWVGWPPTELEAWVRCFSLRCRRRGFCWLPHVMGAQELPEVPRRPWRT